MSVPQGLSRRGFVGGVATAMGYLTLKPGGYAWAQSLAGRARSVETPDEYDAYAKLANNENPYGPSDVVMKAMTRAFKYANRYGYPDGDIVAELAKHHGVKPEQIMLGAGSGEILDVCCTAFLGGEKRVVGSDPSYNILYSRATSIKADVVKIPLLADFRQDIPAMISATKHNYRDVGFVYLCNPNNPTGRIVTKQEIRQLLDAVPDDV